MSQDFYWEYIPSLSKGFKIKGSHSVTLIHTMQPTNQRLWGRIGGGYRIYGFNNTAI
jgi:hypothetical protein